MGDSILRNLPPRYLRVSWMMQRLAEERFDAVLNGARMPRLDAGISIDDDDKWYLKLYDLQDEIEGWIFSGTNRLEIYQRWDGCSGGFDKNDYQHAMDEMEAFLKYGVFAFDIRYHDGRYDYYCPIKLIAKANEIFETIDGRLPEDKAAQWTAGCLANPDDEDSSISIMVEPRYPGSEPAIHFSQGDIVLTWKDLKPATVSIKRQGCWIVRDLTEEQLTQSV